MPIDLIFLSNELINPRVQRDLRVPLEFITFAFIEGKMYTHIRNKGTFVAQENKHVWGNNVVYGALFLIKDFHFYIRSLDAYQGCSLSVLMRNHVYDIHHRIHVNATPIAFQSVHDFCSLKYAEDTPTRAFAYIGNPTHPNIQKRIHSKIHRITDGLDKPAFRELIREVMP